MQIIISGRHVELADSLREHLEERFERLDRFDDVSRPERGGSIEIVLEGSEHGLVSPADVAVLPDGTVLADSHRDAATMDNHRFRPEIDEALAAGADAVLAATIFHDGHTTVADLKTELASLGVEVRR